MFLSQATHKISQRASTSQTYRPRVRCSLRSVSQKRATHFRSDSIHDTPLKRLRLPRRAAASPPRGGPGETAVSIRVSGADTRWCVCEGSVRVRRGEETPDGWMLAQKRRHVRCNPCLCVGAGWWPLASCMMQVGGVLTSACHRWMGLVLAAHA